VIPEDGSRSRADLRGRAKGTLGQWVAGAVVAVAVVAGAASYVVSLPDQYTSTTVVSFAPRVDRPSGADTLQVLASKYVAFLSSPATLRSVAASTGEDARELQDAVRAEIAPATVNLTVSATLDDPARAASTANAFAAAAAAESIDDANLRADVLTPAVEPLGPSGPPRTLMLAVASVAGLGAGLLVGAALAGVRRAALRGRAPEDLEARERREDPQALDAAVAGGAPEPVVADAGAEHRGGTSPGARPARPDEPTSAARQRWGA